VISPVILDWGVRRASELAKAMAGADRIRAAAWRRRRGRAQAGQELGGPPEAVLVAVAHWRPDLREAAEARLAYLEECTAGLLEMPVPRVVAVVLTNHPHQTARDLAERLSRRDAPLRVPVSVAPAEAIDTAPDVPRQVLVVGWRPGIRHRHGFYLTWAHVPIFRRAARSGRFSHLVYLEDDMRFGGEHLRYWQAYRKPLAELGLLPGFVRYEWHNGERFLVDALRPIEPGLRRRVAHVGGRPTHVVNLETPYQALYILDRDLFETHFRFSRGRSPMRSRASDWAVRERAASGPIFDDVPKGFVSRNVVPVRVDGDRQQVDASCLVEHMAPTHSSSASPYGVLRLDELFAARAGQSKG
jgi:hypothetical protein